MFDRIVNFTRNIRIKIDFPRYEKECRLGHKRLAEKLHSTQQLQTEMQSHISKINDQADALFKKDISIIRAGITQIKTNISSNEQTLGYFTRFYKQEIDALYEEKNKLFSEKKHIYNSKNELSSELSVAFEGKKSAYKKLNEHKSSIDSWYAKSNRTPWLFGNSGKKIKKHSVFGQSHGDLDSYKYQRDEAYKDVQRFKKEIDMLKQKQNRFNERINEIKRAISSLVHDINTVKADRARMYELKTEGFNKHKLQHALKELDVDLKIKQANLSELVSKRSEFVTAEKYRHGVIELEKKIKDIQERKIEYIKEFDLENNYKQRIKEHRHIWLKEKNLA